jgi:cobalt-zinc-cadmium resistance protein CzcA
MAVQPRPQPGHAAQLFRCGPGRVALAASVIIARGLGSEFVPKLSEGAVVVNVIRLAGTDLDESVRYNTQMEKVLVAAFPDEIAHVLESNRHGRGGDDPMGVELTDIFMSLKTPLPMEAGQDAGCTGGPRAAELRDMPGQRIAMTQPIEMRYMNEMIAGTRGDLAMKLYGDDFDVLTQKAQEIGAIIGAIFRRGRSQHRADHRTAGPANSC